VIALLAAFGPTHALPLINVSVLSFQCSATERGAQDNFDRARLITWGVKMTPGRTSFVLSGFGGASSRFHRHASPFLVLQHLLGSCHLRSPAADRGDQVLCLTSCQAVSPSAPVTQKQFLEPCGGF